jgi:ABC-2 type transport system permease protein
MNIYWRELKAHRLGVIFWSLGMIALVGAGMAKYSAYSAAGSSVTAMFAQLPKAVMVVFGLSGFDLTKASGFFGVLFLYIAVMAAIHASLLGSNLISKEERDRTSEFLYAKPISRSKALTAKLLAGLTIILILNLATSFSSLYFVAYFGKGESVNAQIWLLMAGLLFMQLIFFAIGALVAGIVGRPKTAPSMATSIMFLTFLIYYLVNFDSGLEFLKWLSPFKYFDAAVLLTSRQLDPAFVALSAAVIVVAVFGTYHFYSARDLTV